MICFFKCYHDVNLKCDIKQFNDYMQCIFKYIIIIIKDKNFKKFRKNG